MVHLVLVSHVENEPFQLDCVFKGCKCDEPPSNRSENSTAQIDLLCLLDENTGTDFPERVSSTNPEYQNISDIVV